jgi:hypothetical protein
MDTIHVDCTARAESLPRAQLRRGVDPRIQKCTPWYQREFAHT